MLFAKVVTEKNFDEITELNGGTPLPQWTKNDHTFFVYGDYETNIAPRVLHRSVFEAEYRWMNLNDSTNEIVFKRD